MFKKIVKSLISNPKYTQPGIETTRTTYLNILLLFAMFIIGFDLYYSLTYGFVVLAAAEIAGLAVLGSGFMLFRRILTYRTAAFMLLGPVAFLSVFSLTVEGYGKEAALFWTASLPIYTFLLLGTRDGFRLSALILAGILLSAANAYFEWVTPIFKFDLLIQLVPGYFAIAASVYYFEKMRNGYEVQLSQVLKERESLLEALGRQKDEIEASHRELAKKVAKIERQDEMLIAQSRLAAMGEMMSMIAHQWRQPLATMSLMIANYKIKAMMEAKAEDERDTILGEISSTMQYLSETVEDFQTYFKPTSSVESSSLLKIIERAAEFTKARLQYNNITLYCADLEECEIATYSNEIVQVVINIINNAIDAIVQRDPAKRLIVVASEQTPEQVVIAISDTGGGIPAETIGRIFEPYFSTKSKNGTGLGLYMAKMIVAKHGNGEIDVENVGEGCRFTLRFAKQAV